jgi:hypothetical protein
MEQMNLGVGTRLQHTQYGPGVVVGVNSGHVDPPFR